MLLTPYKSYEISTEHAHRSEECCNCNGKKKDNNYFVRARFFINAKQSFCKNVKVLKQSRQKKWVGRMCKQQILVGKINN